MTQGKRRNRSCCWLSSYPSRLSGSVVERALEHDRNLLDNKSVDEDEATLSTVWKFKDIKKNHLQDFTQSIRVDVQAVIGR